MSSNPLENICNLWVNVLRKSEEHKEEAFGRTALECWRFFDESHDFMYGKGHKGIGIELDEGIKTEFKMTLNKVSQLVQIFGPTLYFKNPFRQVNPRTPDVPLDAFAVFGDQQMAMMAQQEAQVTTAIKTSTAGLLQWYLNYIPHELDLKWQSRVAIDEALIEGRGVMWHEMFSPPESNVLMPRTYFVSVDDLLIDPDAESLEDAKWIARIRCMPTYEVEERFQLEKGSLKNCGKLESVMQSSDVDAAKWGMHYRKMGETHDLCCYFEVWTKCGMGQFLKSGPGSIVQSEIRNMADSLDEYGRYVYMAICPGYDHLLNLPETIMDAPEDQPGVKEEIQKRLRWPIPFYMDVGGGGWPFTELDFHPIPRSCWPQAHMKPGIGWLKLCNWILSFLAGRIRHTSRLFIAYNEVLDEAQVKLIENGGDLSLIPFKGLINKRIDELIQFLQAPSTGKDIWDIFSAAMQELDKATGLSELMYGMTGKQYRSSAEAQIKQEQINVRPDDMAELVETWQSRIARKEGIMCRLFVGPESVADVFGETYDPTGMQIGPLTRLWQQLVFRPLNWDDPEGMARTFREYDYRIEAGSIRKPNRDRDQANMDQAMQTVFPAMLQYFMQTGDPTQVNALLGEWAKTRDIKKELIMFQPPPPPPQPTPEQQQMDQQAQMQQQGPPPDQMQPQPSDIIPYPGDTPQMPPDQQPLTPELMPQQSMMPPPAPQTIINLVMPNGRTVKQTIVERDANGLVARTVSSEEPADAAAVGA